MTTPMNVPYVKAYDNNGFLANPIIEGYMSNFPNRKQRRKIKQKNRFYGESKNFHLTTTGKYAFRRIKQISFDKDGDKKTIFHYIQQP